MADGDWKDSVQAALNNLALAVKDAARLTVTTYVYRVDKPDNDPSQRQMIAQTELKLDGDANIYVPVREVAGDLQLETALYSEHKAAVDQAKQARSELLTGAKELLGRLKELL